MTPEELAVFWAWMRASQGKTESTNFGEVIGFGSD